MAKKKASHRTAGQKITTEENEKPINVLEFPAAGTTLSPARSHPEPEAVESQAPEKKKGKVLEIVPRVIRAEEIIELCDLCIQTGNAMEKYLEKDREIGAALLAGATVDGDKEQTETARKFSLTYPRSNPNEDWLRGLKLKIWTSICEDAGKANNVHEENHLD